MKSRRVLIVEDERLIARDIAMQLRDLGCEALGPATTGEEAIEMAGKLLPQLVLMDVQLASAMDGLTAAQAIHDRLGLPIVFLSAFNDSESLDRAKLAEPVGFLGKPLMEYELRDVISEVFKAR